jgi:hypothetical protein
VSKKNKKQLVEVSGLPGIFFAFFVLQAVKNKIISWIVTHGKKRK